MAEKAINELLAENLRYYMDLRGFGSQDALAKKIGVVQRTIGYYLDPSKRTALDKSVKRPSATLAGVESLAKGLEVEIWQLLMPSEKREHFIALEEALKAFTNAMAARKKDDPPAVTKPAARVAKRRRA